MKIHHLNCGSMRRLDPTRAGLPSAPAVNHCLLAETGEGLVLVETGLGLADVRTPLETLGEAWTEMAQPVLDEAETALRQVEDLGHDPADVRHVLVTHLDVDHCGGLPDFPRATVHVLAAELRTALTQAPSYRYRPAHWAHGPQWRAYESADDSWFGFGAVQPEGLPEEFKLVPLPGHTQGHAGIAVHDGSRWLLHCGDAYYYHRELEETPETHPVLDVVQTRSAHDHGDRVTTQDRLRALARDHSAEVTLFSAHDPWEFGRLVG
ncbi:MBL fold metallo-hydrolase [Lentzea jiangxiensis]|uniref:Metallo-beta-lactamase superfamily protein n=1 Tax=Lentzea jiangxiensis TaxID=641025 RepID=A0A1H0IVM0_9PSEU|nr:MBL fold metallo-hydrolase [Lentzea jiangxiensis]SDO35574.1 Metallo-beta-lactamase superfamily protein [Lentzea jiangxiensis]